MTVAVVHATVAAGPNDPSKQVSSDAWNAGHTITGLATVATTGAYSDLTGTPNLAVYALAATTLSGYGITDAYTQTVSDARFLGISAQAADSAQLLGKTWAVPAAIGSTTPAAGTFTSLDETGPSHTYLNIRSSGAGGALEAGMQLWDRTFNKWLITNRNLLDTPNNRLAFLYNGSEKASLQSDGTTTFGGGLMSTLAVSVSYTPGSFSLATGTGAILVKRLALSGAQRATLAGTARLVIH